MPALILEDRENERAERRRFAAIAFIAGGTLFIIGIAFGYAWRMVQMGGF